MFTAYYGDSPKFVLDNYILKDCICMLGNFYNFSA